MENIYCVYELGIFEFWGTLTECRQYVAANTFKDSYFNIVAV
jgi:hypothetical protein